MISPEEANGAVDQNPPPRQSRIGPCSVREVIFPSRTGVGGREEGRAGGRGGVRQGQRGRIRQGATGRKAATEFAARRLPTGCSTVASTWWQASGLKDRMLPATARGTGHGKLHASALEDAGDGLGEACRGWRVRRRGDIGGEAVLTEDIRNTAGNQLLTTLDVKVSAHALVHDEMGSEPRARMRLGTSSVGRATYTWTRRERSSTQTTA